MNIAAEIKRLCEQISRDFRPERIILFGSHAYGSPTPDSDVDLLVVMPFEGSSRQQAVKIRSRIDAPLPLDLFVRTPEQLSERLAMGDFFVREIVESGKVLYEADHAQVMATNGTKGRRRVKPFILRTLALILASLSLAIGATVRAGELAGHELLVTSVRTGGTEIFAVDPETGDAENLTRHPAEDRYPAWSPDGRRVAFTSDRDGAFNLYVMDADGRNVRQLTREKSPTVSYMPSWSGDGKRIVFGLHGEKPLMASVRADGSDLKILGTGHDPCISPDGKTVAYTERAGKGFSVFAMDADGKNVRRLTTHENEMGAVHPIWSPDGKRILYSDQVGGALEIFVCDADGKNVRQLTKLGKISTSAAWSPDGKWISFRLTNTAFWRDPAERDKAYQDKEGDKRPVYVMSADGAGPRVVEVLRYQCGIDGSRAAWRPR